MIKIFTVITTSTLVSFVLTGIMIKIIPRFGLVDDVRFRKHPAHTHKGVIPRGGGLPIFLAILITILFHVSINKILLGILIGSFLIVVTGLLDDYYDLSPYLRFALNILIVLLVIFFGLGIPYISNPLGGAIRLDNLVIRINFLGHHKFLFWANLLSIVWIVAVMNFVNWSKGVDGQMPGFVVICSFFLGILAYRFVGHDIAQESVILLAFIVGGAFLGFLYWNFYPQKIMPGYGGGAMAGFFLAVLSILSWGKMGTLILILSIPLIDAIYVMIRRIKTLKSPFRGDAGHFHHRLLQIGWGRRRIALFYWLAAFIFGYASLFFHGRQKILILIGVFISLAIFILITNKIKKIVI